MTERQVLIIGLDGGTLDLIEPWAEQGYLPNLATLMKQGSAGPLTSTLQPVTAPAWCSFMTGMNQGKHGLYDFVRRRQSSYDIEVTNASMIAAPTLFDLLSREGHRVVSLNVPFTYPPHPINGIMVSGAFAPVIDEKSVFPANLYPVLQDLVPGYSAMLDYDARVPEPLAAHAKRIIQTIEQRETLALHLLSREPWSLFMVVFMATDWAQHAYWRFHETADPRYGSVIRDVYARVDAAIGKLQDAVGDQALVVVISDHGAGRLEYIINLNRWLAEADYLDYRDSGRGLWGQLRGQGIQALASRYRRYVPPELRDAIRIRLGGRRFDRLRGQMESALLSAAIDWPRTLAYALGAGGNLYVNLAGREPQGIVQPGRDYEQVRDRLSADLLALTIPGTGQHPVKRVHRREELYRGPFLNQAPDLVIEWADYAFWGRGRYDSRGTVVFETRETFDFSDLPLTGSHRLDGMLVVRGPGVRADARIAGARLIDLAPTVLAHLGMQAPAQMDGAVLWELLTPAERERVRREARLTDVEGTSFEYSPSEAEQISEHLRGMGYL
jgi:predicted AlkP superfamily phosphohydrolase/phosphomutase